LKAYLIDSPAGIFLVEKTGKISEKLLFARNPTDAAVQFKQIQSGELPQTSEPFAQRLAEIEIESITVDTEHLAKLARSIAKAPVVQDETDPTISRLRNRLPSMLVRLRIRLRKRQLCKTKLTRRSQGSGIGFRRCLSASE